MSTYACKVVTDAGDYFALYNTVVDQFVSRSAPSLDALANITGEDRSELEEDLEKHTFNVRRSDLEEVDRMLLKLESGVILTTSEAIAMYNFSRFLEATVADHQCDYSETDEETMETWVREYGLRKHFLDYDAYEVVMDKGLYSAFEERAVDARDNITLGRGEVPMIGQLRIAARYIRTLADIAKILGPDRKPPQVIVDEFYDIFQAR